MKKVQSDGIIEAKITPDLAKRIAEYLEDVDARAHGGSCGGGGCGGGPTPGGPCGGGGACGGSCGGNYSIKLQLPYRKD